MQDEGKFPSDVPPSGLDRWAASPNKKRRPSLRCSTTRLCMLKGETQRRSFNPTSVPILALSNAPNSASVGSSRRVSASSRLTKISQRSSGSGETSTHRVRSGDNLWLMFVGWEGVGLCSFALIGFWYKVLANTSAGNKAFIVNRVGDLAFVIALFSRRVSTLRLNPGLENGTNSGQSGAESGFHSFGPT